MDAAATRGAGFRSMQEKHDHLARTYQLLADRGHRREVCLGGGLHAIYGTSLLHHSMMQQADRSVARKRFGDAAERLAHLFSVLDRPRVLAEPLALDLERAVVELRGGERLELSRRDFDDLRSIECANLADQNALEDHPSLLTLWNGGGARDDPRRLSRSS